MHIVPSLDTGGAEVMLLNLSRYLLDRNYTLIVVTLGDGGALTGKFEALGITVLRLHMRKGKPALSSWSKLRGFFKVYKPDLIHAWMYHAGLAALLANFGKVKAPSVLGVHYSLGNLKTDKFLTRFAVKTLARFSGAFNAVCYVSMQSASDHERLGYHSKQSLIIPNGVDCEYFAPFYEEKSEARKKYKISDGKKVIGILARYHPMKNYKRFFEAAKIVSERDPDVFFVCAGRGVSYENDDLKSMIDAAGLKGNTRLLGESGDVKTLLSIFDIATLSSSWGEALPMFFAEAMAMGVPCVGPELGDIPELLPDKRCLVSPYGAAALANGWLEVLSLNDSEIKILSESMRNRILQNYSIQNAGNKYMQLYESLV